MLGLKAAAAHLLPKLVPPTPLVGTILGVSLSGDLALVLAGLGVYYAKAKGVVSG